jgi:hypothetical protein
MADLDPAFHFYVALITATREDPNDVAWHYIPDMVDEENRCEQERGNMDGPEENGNLKKI